MPVAQNDGIDGGQINPAYSGVVQNSICLSGVQQKLMPFCFDIDTQTVLSDESVIQSGVLNKCNDLHL